MTLPLVLGIGALLFASYGSGALADWFRAKIVDTFGKGMIPGARWFAIIMVRIESSRVESRALLTASHRRLAVPSVPGSVMCSPARPSS